MQQVYEKAEAIINTVVTHLVHLDSMLSAAACYATSLFYQLKLHRNTSVCTVRKLCIITWNHLDDHAEVAPTPLISTIASDAAQISYDMTYCSRYGWTGRVADVKAYYSLRVSSAGLNRFCLASLSVSHFG